MSRWVAFLLMLTAGFSLAAQEAVFKTVTGKVSYQVSGGAWRPAEVGLGISGGTKISTGFKSSAILLVNGSLLVVKPLTRLTLEEILRTGQGPRTNVYLVAGKVKAEVAPSIQGEVTSFRVKSPMATASVRGTGFEFDGQTLLVNHGRVVLTNQYGVYRTITGGRISLAGDQPDVAPGILVKFAALPLLGGPGSVASEAMVAAAVQAESRLLVLGDPQGLEAVTLSLDTTPYAQVDVESPEAEVAEGLGADTVPRALVTLQLN